MPTPTQSENDRAAIGAFAAAHMEGRAPYGSWEFAVRLMQRGVAPTLAVRVAMTPPFTVDAPAEDTDVHPGREIAEAVERNTPDVVKGLLYGTLAVRCPREVVLP